MFNRILIAFNASAHAEQALAEAVELAETANAELTVLTVAPEVYDMTLGYVAPPPDVQGVGEPIEQGFQAMLDTAVERVPGNLPSRRSSGAVTPRERSSTRPAPATTT